MALIAAEELVGGQIPMAGVPASPTFADVAKEWTDGDLHKRFPDQVKRKDWSLDALHLAKLSAIDVGEVTFGEVRIDSPLVLDQAEEAMCHLPDDAKRPGGQVAGVRLRVLYPAEDRALMAHGATPFAYRLVCGFLAREGLRIREAMGLTWKDVDLERGVVTLDRNKTDDARAWALNPGVVPALTAWKERSTRAVVFADADGILDMDVIAGRLRGDLMAA